MSKVFITKEALVNAKGNLNTAKTKPVICIDTGEIYTSCTDAAKANNVHFAAMSNACLGKQKTANGKRFCYVVDLPTHLEALSNSLQSKTNRLEEYGDVIAEREAKENAEKLRKLEEEKKQELIAKAKAKYARAEEKFAKASEARDKLMTRYAKADKEFNTALDNLYLAKEEYDNLCQ